MALICIKNFRNKDTEAQWVTFSERQVYCPPTFRKCLFDSSYANQNHIIYETCPKLNACSMCACWPFVFFSVVFGAFGAVAVAWAVLFGAGAV